MLTESLCTFPPERRADGCFYGDQHVWVCWEREADGSISLKSASDTYGYSGDLLPYYSAEKRADMVRQILEREASERAKRGHSTSYLS